ncbi:penicillin-binding transpeptidase domain-containing protein [Patescibacteria group bacterium]|nr:penicillin-binding transpeptidase domain-containing protein [Patescibacteria group bacterium]
MLGHLLGDSISRTDRRTGLGRKQTADNFGSDHGGSFRLIGVQLLAAAAFLWLLATLVKTQIFAGEYYRDLAAQNHLREVPIHAPRGIIFDRNGTSLTANLPSFRFNNQTISKDQAIVLEAEGKQPEVDSVRSYLKGAAFAHLLGYVSEDSVSAGYKIGQGGVEETYQDRLKGTDGKELIEVDAVGKKIRTISTVPPTPGENLTLTIDAPLQEAAYTALGNKPGAVVAANPKTGEILALVSSPSFDPNVFTDYSLSESERSADISGLFSDPNEPIFNRAISGTFPPGSTFKIVTATAALETGAITAATQVEDTGELVVGPYKFPNWKWLQDGGTQGVLDVVGAIQKSNDIFFYRAGEWTGVDQLMAWAKRFGLGKKLGIDLPGEAAGLIPDLAWREENARNWYLGDTYHAAIGQGDILVTPLQDNAWTNVVANGGKLCTPHVLQIPNSKSQILNCRDLGIKQSTIDLIKKGMEAACAPGGTAYPMYDFQVNGKPVPTACKTGTAEYGDPKLGKTHGWLTIYAPVDDPTISVTVLVEGGGEGSDVAAPVAKKILQEWFNSND